MKRLNALSTLEACLIMLLAILIFFYSKQFTANMLQNETYKKTAHIAYSNLNKAIPITFGKNGFSDEFGNEYDIVKYLSEQIKTLKHCNNAKDELCWSETWLWGDNEKPGIQIKSLQYIVVDFVSRNCSYNNNLPNTCAFVYVDSNGANSPNEVGKDILLFYMTRYGFVPAGVQADTMTPGKDCDIANNQFTWGCTAQLLGLK